MSGYLQYTLLPRCSSKFGYKSLVTFLLVPMLSRTNTKRPWTCPASIGIQHHAPVAALVACVELTVSDQVPTKFAIRSPAHSTSPTHKLLKTWGLRQSCRTGQLPVKAHCVHMPGNQTQIGSTTRIPVQINNKTSHNSWMIKHLQATRETSGNKSLNIFFKTCNNQNRLNQIQRKWITYRNSPRTSGIAGVQHFMLIVLVEASRLCPVMSTKNTFGIWDRLRGRGKMSMIEQSHAPNSADIAQKENKVLSTHFGAELHIDPNWELLSL